MSKTLTRRPLPMVLMEGADRAQSFIAFCRRNGIEAQLDDTRGTARFYCVAAHDITQNALNALWDRFVRTPAEQGGGFRRMAL